MCNEYIQNAEKVPFPQKSLSDRLCLIFHALEVSCLLIPLTASIKELHIFTDTVLPVKVLMEYICINQHSYISLYKNSPRQYPLPLKI